MPDTPNPAEPGKLRRRWSQFGLRTLLVGVAAVAMLCPLGVRLYRQWEASRECAILCEIHSLDGDSMRPYKERYVATGLSPTRDR